MNLCSAGHDQVCYESGFRCPVCEMEIEKDKEISRLEDDIVGLENKVGELESERDEARAEAESLREGNS